MPRYLYILEDDKGLRTAHALMRGAKLQATTRSLESGKVWRVSVSESISGRELYAALYNGEGLDDWTLVNLIERGRLKKLPDSE